MSCPHCSSHDVGKISFEFVEAGFHYCRLCEHRWWQGAKSAVGLDEILEVARGCMGRAG